MMADERKNNQMAAFPVFFPNDTPWHYDAGMTLRDWFAGMVISGCLSDGSIELSVDTGTKISTTAYRIADAMMEAREK